MKSNFFFGTEITPHPPFRLCCFSSPTVVQVSPENVMWNQQKYNEQTTVVLTRPNWLRLLSELGMEEPSEEECHLVRHICHAVSRRAAHMLAAGSYSFMNWCTLRLSFRYHSYLEEDRLPWRNKQRSDCCHWRIHVWGAPSVHWQSEEHGCSTYGERL